MVSLTRGEMGKRGTLEQRATEFANSSVIMGLSTHKMLDMEDGFVEVNRENKLKVVEVIREYRPALVFTPYWETRHPDHAQCSHLVRESVFLAGLKKIVTGQPHFRPKKVVYYCEHYPFNPSFIVDVSDTFARRMEAIKAYKSQVFNPDLKENGEEQTHISSPEYFTSLIARAQFWGGKIGVDYGEPFFVREPLKVKDPYELLIK
jgi:bacillithiol biosynthesis deacetylase BshB1